MNVHMPSFLWSCGSLVANFKGSMLCQICLLKGLQDGSDVSSICHAMQSTFCRFSLEMALS